jgi:hypothetical protein
MTALTILHLARALGKLIVYNDDNNLPYIDGHRYDRWYHLHALPDASMIPNSSNTYIRGMHA